MADKYNAVWVSHSSISDYLKCPRLYYLKNIYKDPYSGRKITIITPPLALGQTIHEVLEKLSYLAAEERFKTSLLDKFQLAWKKVSGEKGGFEDEKQEAVYKTRAEKMIKNIIQHPGPLIKKAVKINQNLPSFWLSEADNLILCGKIDWLEYLKKNDSVHIIDFKTGRSTEDESSLQLPIYLLLVSNCQQRPVTKASYWYLDRESKPTGQKLPTYDESLERVLKIAKKIKLARALNKLECPNKKDGCKHCLPFEKIVRGEEKKVGINDYNADMYILKHWDKNIFSSRII